jgi:glycerophosphoryl diester phosphodiesterase
LSSTLHIIGHRGASAHAPENTLAAFKLALEAGADGIEFDVRLTRDGIPVVIHDETLRRTGGKNVQISDLCLQDLKGIDVGTWFPRGNFIGEPMPTLQDVCDLFRGTDSLLYLEMKSNQAERQQLAEACCEAVRKNGLKERVIIESFDLPALKCVKNVDVELRTAALFEPSLFVARKIIDAAKAVGADEVALHHRLATNKNVRDAIDAGLPVVVWTVDNPDWIERATNLGIKALITNDPALMLKSVQRPASMAAASSSVGARGSRPPSSNRKM